MAEVVKAVLGSPGRFSEKRFKKNRFSRTVPGNPENRPVLFPRPLEEPVKLPKDGLLDPVHVDRELSVRGGEKHADAA